MQNEIDFEFTAQSFVPIDAALTTLETFLEEVRVLSADDKAGLVRPPENAFDWMQGVAARAEQRIELMPREYTAEMVRRDLDVISNFEPRMVRLERILDKMKSATFLARSDAFSALLMARRRMLDSKVSGVDDDLNDGLKRFFRRSSLPVEAPAPAPAPAPAT